MWVLFPLQIFIYHNLQYRVNYKMQKTDVDNVLWFSAQMSNSKWINFFLQEDWRIIHLFFSINLKSFTFVWLCQVTTLPEPWPTGRYSECTVGLNRGMSLTLSPSDRIPWDWHSHPNRQTQIIIRHHHHYPPSCQQSENRINMFRLIFGLGLSFNFLLNVCYSHSNIESSYIS